MKLLKLSILLLSVSIRFSFANIINVPSDVDSIQGGIDMAVNGDTVLVQPGIYYENIDFLGKKIIVGSLTLTTGEKSYIHQTIIDGDSCGSVVRFGYEEDSTAMLCGFTLINGTGTGHRHDGGSNYLGGGIYCLSEPTLKDLIIKGNLSTIRGGIYCGLGLTFINVTITENKAGTGGGIYFGPTSFPGGKRSNIADDHIKETKFDSLCRCNIYRNNAEPGSDLFSWIEESQIKVYLDTFTVLIPDSTHAYPLSNFSFDILNESVTKIELLQNQAIYYELLQNYPNPFNPSTTIEFTLPKSGFTSLKAFNTLGQEVATLVSDKLNQGNHAYIFNGKNLASSVYYYQLVAGGFREVKKMILLR